MISLEAGELIYTLVPGYPGDATAELRDALLRATGERWQVTRAEGDAQPSLKWDEDMTKKQKAFWYGSANAAVGGTIMIGPAAGSSGKSGCAVIALGLLAGSLGLAVLCVLCL